MLDTIKYFEDGLFRSSFEQATDESIEKLKEVRRVAIVSQAWSLRKDGKPGRGNEELANVFWPLYEKLPEAKTYPQIEVSLALSHRRFTKVIGEPSDGRSSIAWNTYAVAQRQMLECRKENIMTVVVIAHPLHMVRALWTYRRLGLVACPGPVTMDWDAYVDPELVHWACRSKRLYPALWAREMAAKSLFFKLELRGKLDSLTGK